MEAIQESYQEGRLFDEIKALRTMIIDIQTKQETPKKEYETNDLAKLYAALIKTQMEMEKASKSCEQAFYKNKYANFTSVVEASRRYLASNGLGVMQLVLPGENGTEYLHTRLFHESGQSIESKMLVNTPNNNPQERGKYITYFKRYSYAALVGIIEGDDDDCESNMNRNIKKEVKITPHISKTQLATLSNELNGNSKLLGILLNEYNISKLADLGDKDFRECFLRVKTFNQKSSVMTA